MSSARSRTAQRVRHLVLVLGDQLDPAGPSLDGIDRERDRVLMCEVAEEARYVPQHRQRLVLFFSAMRHFAAQLRRRRMPLDYRTLDDADSGGDFASTLRAELERTRPERMIVTLPGDHRVLRILEAAAAEAGVALELRADRHFLSSPEDFAAFARGRKVLRLEDYYRQLRRRHGILMDGEDPAGGRWNFDADNRRPFGKGGPGMLPAPARFAPDRTTRDVMALVARHFPDAPGRLDSFEHPVSASDAATALEDFISRRLAHFGDFQDAMAAGQPFLYHSLLSAPLNLHLLDPRVAIDAAAAAHAEQGAPLNAVEGFVRQILGWREYVRGIYWTRMPEYASLNALDADLPMPAFMWTADTELRCVHESVSQLVEHAYAHHIQRLMVLGQLAMLLGVRPYDVHRWHLSMYIDAVDWVSLPNVVGMSQYADGGIVGSKPYCASGAYINRMSDYCSGCRYDPKRATGDDACPFTTLYWDFLMRHERRLAGNQRMSLQLRNVARKDASERRAIARRASEIKVELTRETYL